MAIRGNYAFSFCTFDKGGNVLEWLAEIDDWDGAVLVFDHFVAKYPDEIVVWRNGARCIQQNNPIAA